MRYVNRNSLLGEENRFQVAYLCSKALLSEGEISVEAQGHSGVMESLWLCQAIPTFSHR